MTYSTELPPNFKTWNELWSKFLRDGSLSYDIGEATYWQDGEIPFRYPLDFIKARCLDEIMELLASMPKLEDDVNQEDSLYMCHFLVSRLSALTHTKLFK